MSSEVEHNQDKQEGPCLPKKSITRMSKLEKESDELVSVLPSGMTRKFHKIGRYTGSKNFDKVMINVTEDMTAIKNMSMREDDTLLVAYAKSGTNWTSEILKMVMSGKADYHNEYKMNEWIEVQPLGKLESLPSPRVLNTHLAVQDLPNQVIEKRCKVVLVHRNPKDVCVSFYHHFKGSGYFDGPWDDFVYLFFENKYPLYYSWFQFTKEAHEFAKQHDFVYSLSFEDLKTNSRDEIKRLAKFLNVQLSDNLANDIAEKCSFSNLKKAATEVKAPRKFHGSAVKPPKYDMFRKGEVADWKNWFTVAQNERVNKLYEEQMKGCDIQIKFTI